MLASQFVDKVSAFKYKFDGFISELILCVYKNDHVCSYIGCSAQMSFTTESNVQFHMWFPYCAAREKIAYVCP